MYACKCVCQKLDLWFILFKKSLIVTNEPKLLLLLWCNQESYQLSHMEGHNTPCVSQIHTNSKRNITDTQIDSRTVARHTNKHKLVVLFFRSLLICLFAI